jgi:hypothetical protein
MKKGLFVLGFGIVALTSCVKERTCTCTTTDSSTGFSVTDSEVYTTDKETAQTACDLNEGTFGTFSTTCTLD